MWSGAANAVPSGWYLCNGSNGTPDLRGKFVVGYSNTDGLFDVGDSGGSKDATLVSHSHTVNNHTHSFSGTTNNPGDHNHSYTFLEKNVAYGGGSSAYSRTTTGATTGNAGGHTHTVSGTIGGSSPGTNSQGSSATNANLPPYYALCYIMKA